MKGKLIAIEGLDGSGKATQTKLLYKELCDMGVKVRHISFPDYKEPSSTLVKMYLNSEFGASPSDVNAYAASSFYAVDRYASFMKFWKSDYENDYVILCDRYVTSNAIYQMSKMDEVLWEEYLNWLYDYEYDKLGLPRPCEVIYLNVPIEISQRLMDARYSGTNENKDIHEKNIEFLKRCRRAALYVAKKDGWKVIDCVENSSMRAADDIHNDILKMVSEII